MSVKLNIIKQKLSLFENNKIQILQLWITNQNLLDILNKYNITKENFMKDYAIGILEYYINIIHEKASIGYCPVIDLFLEFLKDKNVEPNELFIVCSGLKKSLIEFTYTQGIDSLELTKEITYVYERNFEGVLKSYAKKSLIINEKLQKSYDFISDHIIMSSTNTKGIIISVSKAFCDISGYSKQELIGQNHNIIRHPSMSEDIFNDLWKTISSGKIWTGEIKNLKKDGEFYWVSSTVTPDFDDENNIIGYSAVRQDITSKKQVEEQQALLVEQSRSAAMGEMIAMLAHQWRQPLQATSMLIQQLTLEKMLDGVISDETLENVTSNTKKQIEYMSKTIDDFRDFFSPNKNRNKILLNDLIDKARDLMAYTLKSDDIALIINVEDDIEISVHINEIVQVLINIIKNARDALIEIDEEVKYINIKAYKDGLNVVIEILDNAGGIPHNVINNIFDAYYSTKKNKNGTGLGLYMSKNIIEKQANGILSVQNRDDGAQFNITLPIE